MINFVFKLALVLLVFVGTIPVSAQTTSQIQMPDYNPRSVGAPLEVHIYDNGSVLIHGARVEQVAGSTIYTKVYWGLAFLRLTIRTTDKTVFVKKNGSETRISDIKVGDFITIEGDFYSGTSSLDVTARKIKNWSLQTETGEYSGDVASFSNTPGGFSMQAKDGLVTVKPVNGAQIKKGNLFINLDLIKVGDKVTIVGTYDRLKKEISATFISVYQNMKLFEPKLYEGTLVSVGSDSSSVVIFNKKENKNYTVKIGSKTSIVNKAKAKVSLKRFATDDYIRVWGTLREDDYTAVDAEVVRNVDL
jgi:hypothetical protein